MTDFILNPYLLINVFWMVTIIMVVNKVCNTFQK